jgi:hypothetical protein
VLPAWRTLATLFILPPLFAGCAGTMVGKRNPWVKDYYGLSAFTATRPLRTVDLVAAKFKMAALSTLAAWAVVAVAAPGALFLTGAQEEVALWWRQTFQGFDAGKLAVMVLLAWAGLVVLTWRQLVENLVIGLTGREWVIKGYLYGGIGVGTGLLMFGGWVFTHPEYHAALVELLPWLVGTAAGMKLAAAGWAVCALYRNGLVETPTLKGFLAGWLLAAVGLLAVLWWLVPTGQVSLPPLAFGVVLFLPLTRLAAAPVVLAWNRHR